MNPEQFKAEAEKLGRVFIVEHNLIRHENMLDGLGDRACPILAVFHEDVGDGELFNEGAEMLAITRGMRESDAKLLMRAADDEFYVKTEGERDLREWMLLNLVKEEATLWR